MMKDSIKVFKRETKNRVPLVDFDVIMLISSTNQSFVKVTIYRNILF